MLKIIYKSKKLEKICTNFTNAVKVHGEQMAIIIHQRIGEITAADSIEMLVKHSIGRCHPLTGNRKGQHSMDLIKPFSLIIEGDKTGLKIVKIVKIENYH